MVYVEVVLTDGSVRFAQVPAGLPEWRQMWLARQRVRDAGFVPFSARPSGCTGEAHNVHFGRFCPVHPGS